MATKALPSGNQIDFSTHGIGEVIIRNRLRVPPHQREYSWTEKQVTDLFQDIGAAIARNKPAYFLGTIVLTGGPGAEIKEVADGQQRLATTVILLAAIRDFYFRRGEKNRIRYMEEKFLCTVDLASSEEEPKLTLNVDDNEFFRRAILPSPDSSDREVSPTKRSHELIAEAAKLARDHIKRITKPLPESVHIDHLNQWVKFVEQSALVNALIVPDDLNAFVMFETLNDRGLKTSQADLLKNYLFGEAAERVPEAQQRWSSMVGALETVDIDDVVMLYLRHLASAMYGATREREVFEKIKLKVSGKTNSMAFLTTLEGYAEDYVAILNPAHPKWNEYAPNIRRSVATLSLLAAEQIRPLLLAVAHHFSAKEAATAFRLFVAWVVRFLIVGGSRGGTLDAAYSKRATEVCEGKITTAKQLNEAMKDLVPTDAQFQAEFATCRVTKASLARYYLRALELCYRGEKEPEFVPNEDQSEINLEHVLPENPGKGWTIKPEIAAAFYKRLGNLVLLKASPNSTIGNEPFAAKKRELESSTYKLTEVVGKAAEWGTDEIEARQKKLAEIAVKTWPLRA
jgi:hypothetical protein